MVAWVVIDRTHSRQNPPPFFPCSHSRFGSNPSPSLSPIPYSLSPLFSCTYVEPILQPICFQVHAWNGRLCTPLPDLPAFEPSDVPTRFPAFSFLFKLLRPLLRSFALVQNSTL